MICLVKNRVIKDKSICSVGMNDGSFINKPIEPVVSHMEVNRESMEDKVDGVGDCVDPLSGYNKGGDMYTTKIGVHTTNPASECCTVCIINVI